MDNSSRLMFAVVMVMAYMAMGAQAQNSTMVLNFTMAANDTTTGPNITTTLSTTHSQNVNISTNGTMAPNTTTTTVVPVVNTPVRTDAISRTECGKTKLCAAEPENCDPAAAAPDSCFFVSTKQSSGQTFTFQLRGVSSGYIAVGLSTDSKLGGNNTIYVCANNSGSVKFFTTLLDKEHLSFTNTGSGKGQIIQCTFNATVPNATVTTGTRGSSTSFFLSIFKGFINNGILVNSTAVLFSDTAVDLANYNSTVRNSLKSNTTTFASTTTIPSHAFGLQNTLSQALLILLGVLGMMML